MSTLELTIDVETIPTQNPKFIAELDVKCPGNITKPESIIKWEKDKKPGLLDEAYRKTALNSTKGELCVIGWAINDKDPQCVYRGINDSEADLLQAFYDCMLPNFMEGYYSNVLWIGHNILPFDLPFIWHRSIINNVKTAVHIPYNAKIWSESVFDTKAVWKANSSASSSLKDICTAIGIPVKQGMDGSEVWDYVKRGEIQKVADYCMNGDVVATRSLYHAMRG